MNENGSAAPNEGRTQESGDFRSAQDRPFGRQEDGEPEEDISGEESEGTGEVSEGDKGDARQAASGDVPAGAQEEPAQLIYTPVFRGEVRPVAAQDRETVTAYLQKGMQYDALMPRMEKLNMLTHMAGAKDADEFLDRMTESYDRSALKEAIDKYGERDGRAFYQTRRDERQRGYRTLTEQNAQEAQNDRDAVNRRLAQQFLELQAEYEDVKSFKDLPSSVVNMALERGISLLDAYNRTLIRRSRAQRAAKAAQQAAQKSAAPSLRDVSGEDGALEDAFLAGLAQ